MDQTFYQQHIELLKDNYISVDNLITYFEGEIDKLKQRKEKLKTKINYIADKKLTTNL